jgi:hypothetical protein
MNFFRTLQVTFFLSIGSCLAPTPVKTPTATEQIKALHKNFAQEIAAREKAGLPTGGFATKRTLFGGRKLTQESKDMLNTAALQHKNGGVTYGEYADPINHQHVINKATDKMNGRGTNKPKARAPKVATKPAKK